MSVGTSQSTPVDTVWNGASCVPVLQTPTGWPHNGGVSGDHDGLEHLFLVYTRCTTELFLRAPLYTTSSRPHPFYVTQEKQIEGMSVINATSTGYWTSYN